MRACTHAVAFIAGASLVVVLAHGALLFSGPAVRGRMVKLSQTGMTHVYAH